MKKRWFSLILCVVMICSLISGCGSDVGSTSDEGENYENADAQAEDTLLTEDTEYDPETTIVFSNGDKFQITEYKIEENQNNYYKIKDSESVIEAQVITGQSASEAATIMADNMREQSGETPLTDFHSEGVYITGVLDEAFCLCYLADGEDCTYIMAMRTVDVDNCIDIFNSIIDDFLASDLTKDSARTAYGQPVGDEVNDDSVDATSEGE